MQLHPHLDLADQLIRMLGWPALLGALVWVIRKWDKASAVVASIQTDTMEARRMSIETLGKVDVIQTSHLAHLQEGITQVAASNAEAVSVLHEIKAGIGILVDRTPRG